jgi:hypothetical protein
MKVEVHHTFTAPDPTSLSTPFDRKHMLGFPNQLKAHILLNYQSLEFIEVTTKSFYATPPLFPPIVA